LLNGAKASVTGMERGILSSAYEKNRIKQADRLLSNKHIVNEKLPNYLITCLPTYLPTYLLTYILIYQAIYTQYANALSRLIILIDWSDLDTHKGCFLLRASVAFNGRGVAIY
jgi:hypothetical protein